MEGEIDIAAKFMEGVAVQVQQDSWSWEADPSGSYTVGSTFKLLSRHVTDENKDGVFIDLWKLKVPSKASHFACRLIWDKLPTKVNLRRRNVELNDICYPFCRICDEDASHLFFSCAKTMPLWWE